MCAWGKGRSSHGASRWGPPIFGEKPSGEKDPKGANADDAPNNKFVVRACTATSLAGSTTTIKAYIPRLNMTDAKRKKLTADPNAPLCGQAMQDFASEEPAGDRRATARKT